MKEDILKDCPSLLRDFLFYMETIRGRSARTVEGYYVDLRTFLRYIKATKLMNQIPHNDEDFHHLSIASVSTVAICHVTLSDVYAFLNFCVEELGNQGAARARKVTSIRVFYKYICTKTPYLDESPVQNLELPSPKRPMPKYLTLEESLELLNNVQSSFTQRDFCIITLLLNCGMRVSELVGIDLSDIRDDSLRLLGKGNKERIVYLNASCLAAINEYLKVRKVPENCPAEDRNALFISSHGSRLTARRVEQIVENAMVQAGLGNLGYSPHKLRHTAATLLYQHGGVDIRTLKELLGHENLATTEIYTHVSNRQVQEAAQKSPLAKVKPKKAPAPLPSAQEKEEKSKK